MSSLSTPEIVVLMAVIIAVSGMVFALKRQENVLEAVDNADWQQKYIAAERANRYLMDSLRKTEEEWEKKYAALQAEMKLMQKHIETMSIEQKQSNERRLELAAEVDALRRVVRDQ